MIIASIHSLNSVDALIGDTVMVATSDAPKQRVQCCLTGICYRPSTGVPHDASQAAPPLDDPSGCICIEVHPSRTADAVVCEGKHQGGSLHPSSSRYDRIIDPDCLGTL